MVEPSKKVIKNDVEYAPESMDLNGGTPEKVIQMTLNLPRNRWIPMGERSTKWSKNDVKSAPKSMDSNGGTV